jgi:Ankyrin repeats (3 copies)
VSGGIDTFLRAALVPRDASHSSGTLVEAEALLARNPELSGASIHVSAALGDEAGVRGFLNRDPRTATAAGGPYGWDPLTHIAFSRYLRLDPGRSAGFVEAARVLLEAGASAHAGWLGEDHLPTGVWESVLYGAAGIAHHAGLTRLLLAHGADPNDAEVAYHAPEGYDNAALRLVVETGRLTAANLALMLLRKHDWHDEKGVRYLLAQGADPNLAWRPGLRAMLHAVRRDNSREIVAALLDYGGDPALAEEGLSAIGLAARRGRGDLLELFEGRGFTSGLIGVEALLAACARHDRSTIEALRAATPALVASLVARGGATLGMFAGNGNVDGVRCLLELGVPVDARYEEGDAYFGIAPGSTALHVAAWRGWPAVVELLLERGARADTPDGAGRRPLALAVKATVDSYWTERRSPRSVAALLRAGASAIGVDYPSGYPEVDRLLEPHLT